MIPSQLLSSRSYASKKGKGGKSGGGSSNKAQKKGSRVVEEEEDNQDGGEVPPFDVSAYSAQLKRAVDGYTTELGNLSVRRANPAVLDAVVVTHHKDRVRLNQVAQVTVRDPQTLMVMVHDEDFVPVVENAIRSANLGFNPVREGPTMLKIPVPKLTQEARTVMLRTASQLAEKCRVKLRHVRTEAKTDLKKYGKANNLSEDDVKNYEKKIQTEIDKHIQQVDNMLNAKQKELGS
ncbi:hypothetical protein HK102_010447 [Quaeritorhiza haematococci]|nr:hypothetical protein HK102_010447 [Quaeritorhiza haematococci]